MSVSRHRPTVVCFRIDPCHNIPDIHFIAHAVLRNIFSVSQLHSIVGPDSFIDDHREIVKKNFAAPPVNKALVYIPIQSLHEVDILIICRRCSCNVRLPGVLAVRREHDVKCILPVLSSRANVGKPTVAHRVVENRLQRRGDAGVPLLRGLYPEKLISVK